MEKIALLGCTGSIGTQVLNVVRRYSDKFKIEALAAGSNVGLLDKQVEEFKPSFCGINDYNKKDSLNIKKHSHTKFEFGADVLKTAVSIQNIDTVIIAVAGMCGLNAMLEAIKCNKKILLASKEILVGAGNLIAKLVKEKNIRLIPIDSEHSAIFQCLQGNNREQLKRIILTASGGPFLNKSIEDLQNVSLEDTLNHPKWNMGKKITVDSATLMNKGLEVIEAKWLFDLEPDQIDCIIHPQSIIHSMVEYADSSVICQMSYPTMEISIQYALSCPERFNTQVKSLDFAKIKNLEFIEIDKNKFPCFNLAIEALKNNLTLVLNSSNEVVVEKYLNGKLKFTDISKYVECSLNKFHKIIIDTMDDVFYYDQEVRQYTDSIIK